jgi:twitching motility protein PilI
MANKEALRELQARLAQRMQAAKTDQRGHSWLAVDCAGHGMLFPLEQAGEIFDAGTVLAVPHTQSWFAGVANLRGGLHGVVDLAAFLGLRARAPGDAPREGARLVALNPGLAVNCALLVDRLAGLRHDVDLTTQVSTDGVARPGFAGARWRDASGREWQEIKLSALAADGQFLGIAG